MTDPNVILDLIKRFEDNAAAYKSGHYNETQLRLEFVNPFFKCLGWDMDNVQGYAEAYKDLLTGKSDELGRSYGFFVYIFGRLVNVLDVPPLCSFILPAIVRTGPLAIAISTAGASPALAKRMKREIADAYGEPYARLAVLLNEARGWAKGTLPTYQDRKVFFEAIVNGDPDPIELLRAGDEQAVRDVIADAQRAHATTLTASSPPS